MPRIVLDSHVPDSLEFVDPLHDLVQHIPKPNFAAIAPCVRTSLLYAPI